MRGGFGRGLAQPSIIGFYSLVLTEIQHCWLELTSARIVLLFVDIYVQYYQFNYVFNYDICISSTLSICHQSESILVIARNMSTAKFTLAYTRHDAN